MIPVNEAKRDFRKIHVHRSPGLIVAADFHGPIANKRVDLDEATRFGPLDRSWGPRDEYHLTWDDVVEMGGRPKGIFPIVESNFLYKRQIEAINALPGQKIMFGTGGPYSLRMVQKAVPTIDWKGIHPPRKLNLDDSPLVDIKLDPKFYVDGVPPFKERDFLELVAEAPDCLGKMDLLARWATDTGFDILAIDDAFGDRTDVTFRDNLEMLLGSIKSEHTGESIRAHIIAPLFEVGHTAADHKDAKKFCADIGLPMRSKPTLERH